MAGVVSARINSNPMANVVSRRNHSRSLLPYAPVRVAVSCNQSYWASISADIEAHLKQAMPVTPPLTVVEPMRHLTFAATPSTAPALCVAACEIVGGHRDQAMAAASALQLMHAASYTHEHLPLTDRVNPKPQINHVYGPNVELLTGDAMLPFGLELLARSDDPTKNNSDRICRVIIEITRAIGSQGIISGQYYELEQPQVHGEESHHGELIQHVSEMKEGRLHACASACGAILGGGSEEEVERLRKFGLYAGKIQGIRSKSLNDKAKGLTKCLEDTRNLALKELKDFNEGQIEAISSFLEPNSMYT